MPFTFPFTPSYKADPQRDQLDSSQHFAIFPSPEILDLVQDCTPDKPFLDDVYTRPDGLHCDPVQGVVLGDPNHDTKEQEAKRARAQALREELAQLVAEGL